MTHDRERSDDLPDDGRDAAPDAAELRLVALLRGARDHYNVPPAPPPADALWAAIEARHFGPAAPVAPPAPPAAPAVASAVVPIAVRRRVPARWSGPVVGLAAGLLLGVGIGAALWRGADAARPAAPVAVAPAAPAGPGRVPAVHASAGDGAHDAAYDAVAIEYFDQAVALLATLPTRLDDARPDTRLAAQARDLLSTTRLLLDSPAAGHDAELQALLDDLELVLAQIVRLPAVRDSSQAALIHEALQARDVLPRLRTAAAQASAPMQSFGADD